MILFLLFLSVLDLIFIRELEIKDDYITYTYQDILSRKIESLQSLDNIEESSKDRQLECYNKILFFFDHMINNSDQQHKRSPSDICKSFADRISGKDSLIRENIMGKRVDFSARTVLGPNLTLSFGEIAPPKVITKKDYMFLKKLLFTTYERINQTS